MNLRWTELKNYNKNFDQKPQKLTVNQAKITISSKVNGRIKLSYLVKNGGWIPMYELRNSVETSKIDLTYKAHVFQNTGMNWTGIKLSLSINNP